MLNTKYFICVAINIKSKYFVCETVTYCHNSQPIMKIEYTEWGMLQTSCKVW